MQNSAAMCAVVTEGAGILLISMENTITSKLGNLAINAGSCRGRSSVKHRPNSHDRRAGKAFLAVRRLSTLTVSG